MKTSETTAVLPPLYAGWMDELLRASIPPETRATCDDCAMCAPEGESAAADPNTVYFSPQVKCCTYQPSLPNYLVGRLLEDQDFAFSEGRATVERRIDGGIGVTPLGLDHAATYVLLYQHSPAGFGRAASMRCPHYLEEGGGRCGIWRHRNSVCATWFCKYERGGLGMVFWDRTRELLLAVERDLAAWCVRQSDLEAEALDALFPVRRKSNEQELIGADELEGRANPGLARTLWGKWLGREREFYWDCARRVDPLTWEDVLTISGPHVAIRARLARQAFEALRSEKLPERLRVGNFEVIRTSREGVRVAAYSDADPLELAPEVLKVLPYFDGTPTADALRAIERDLGLEVEKDLVRRLSDFRILVPVKDEGA